MCVGETHDFYVFKILATAKSLTIHYICKTHRHPILISILRSHEVFLSLQPDLAKVTIVASILLDLLDTRLKSCSGCFQLFGVSHLKSHDESKVNCVFCGEQTNFFVGQTVNLQGGGCSQKYSVENY